MPSATTVVSHQDQDPLVLERVTVRRETRTLIDTINLRLERKQNWVVIGANGSGKTTLLRVAALYEHPTSGTVRVLGQQLGNADVRELRRHVGFASAGLSNRFRGELRAEDVVVTAKNAALEPWWHRYDEADRDAARHALERLGVAHLAQQTVDTLSAGERQRVMLARTLINRPSLVLLDEPSAGLDLAGREQLVAALSDMMQLGVSTLVVTHHLHEIPSPTTHALLLRDGAAIAAGAIDGVLNSTTLSECFEMSLRVERRDDGRYFATAAG